MGIEGTPVLDQLGQEFPPIDPQSLSSAASLGLPGRLESVRRAREFTRRTLHGWRLPEQFDTVGLVVSELVTNALRHAVTGGTAESDLDANCVHSVVGLELMRYTRRLVCAVRDPSDAVPHPNAPDSDAESGRGLHLVESFSDSWGCRPVKDGRSGKVVWATFLLPHPNPATRVNPANGMSGTNSKPSEGR